ncbi:MAG: TRAP transporter small permease [Rhodospirillales bacterium]|nr:TRAP transporter small permease [Rhodospirillales bacterium]
MSEHEQEASPVGGASNPSSEAVKSSLTGKLGFALDILLSAMNSIGSGWIFLLMVMICVDATGRTFFTHPINGVNEMVEMSIVGIVFMQLGDATRRGRLTRSDGFYNLMNRRAHGIWRVQASLFEILGVVFFAIVLAGAIPEMLDAYRLDYFVGEEGLFTFPEWPIKLVIVLGCLVTLMQFLRVLWRIVSTGSAVSAGHANPPALTD